MSVNAIFACKLYKASKHKDKIRAAIANPINSELVLQLNEYLNIDDLQDIQDRIDESEPSDQSNDAVDAPKENDKEVIRPSQHSAKSAPSTPPASAPDHHLSEAAAEVDKERDEALDSDKKTFDVQRSDTGSADQDVAETTTIDSSQITVGGAVAAKLSIKGSLESHAMLTADEISGLLNAKDNTAGVCRVIIKDEELWIHYNDNINLNNVMEPVIALLNAANYSILNFNRLARTENAIVFTITESLKPIDPVGDIDE